VRRDGAGGKLLVPTGTPDPGDPDLEADGAADEKNIYAGTAGYEHPPDLRVRAMSPAG
jgi:hypothetical protein